MHPDDDLRSRLDRLVAAPDARVGWEEHRVRARRAQRRRERVIASCGAVVVAVLVVGVAVAVGNHRDDQSVRTANGDATTTPAQTTSVPDSPVGKGGTVTIPGRTTIPGGNDGPGVTTGPGGGRPTVPGGGSSTGSGGTTPGGGSTPATTPGGGPSGSGGTTVPGGGSTGGTTEPGSTAATTTTSPATASIDEVKAAIQDLLGAHQDVVRGDIGEATLAGTPVVSVHLRADAKALADQIQRTWPDRTVIYLGFFPYGPGSAPSSTCSAESIGATATALPFGLVGSTTLSPAAVPSGADFQGTVTITNKGPSIVTFIHGSRTSVTLYRTTGGAPVGCSDATISSDDIFDTIDRGTTGTVSVRGGTASTDRKLFAVPAGTYTGLIKFQVGEGNVVSFRFPVTIT